MMLVVKGNGSVDLGTSTSALRPPSHFEMKARLGEEVFDASGFVYISSSDISISAHANRKVA